MNLTIAQIQSQIINGEIRTNIDMALNLAEKACSSAKVDFLVLPEMWSIGFVPKKQILDNADSTGYILKKLSELAAQYKTRIICGTLPEIEKASLYNTAFVIDEYGQTIGKYRKTKLFPLTGEDASFTPGDLPGVFATSLCKIGLAICFDLRFPELFTRLANNGAAIIFLPAQFAAARQDHWLTLNKARAIENQVFVVATNGIVRDHKHECAGRSIVVTPWGDILADAGEAPCYLVTSINLDEINQARQKLPMR